MEKAVVPMLALSCASAERSTTAEDGKRRQSDRFTNQRQAGMQVLTFVCRHMQSTIDGMWQNGDYIQTSGTNAYAIR